RRTSVPAGTRLREGPAAGAAPGNTGGNARTSTTSGEMNGTRRHRHERATSETPRDDLPAGLRREGLQGDERQGVSEESDGAIGKRDVRPPRMPAAERPLANAPVLVPNVGIGRGLLSELR